MMYGDLLNEWFDSRFLPGLELITTYVDDVERECKHSIETFNASDDGYEQQVGLDEAGNEVMHWVKVHKGLSENAWCLPEIFEHYFPTLKRRAALAVLCGHMEHELNELCREVESQLVVTVSFDDMKGQGVTRAALYLQKIGNVILDIGKEPKWKKMAEAFLLRNSVVHAGGRAEKQEVREIVRRSKFLDLIEHTNEVHILDGYLRDVVANFTEVGRVIDEALKTRFRIKR
ncbi:hypothetical protein PQR37_19175 [Paraburkholderia nemoris]|uniref:hypothetical protein n=1 Tax=Paraburkholderia nemoris TaxID=2793076 RepID=UPI0038BBA8C8